MVTPGGQWVHLSAT